MQIASFRIGTRVTMFISYDDNHYTACNIYIAILRQAVSLYHNSSVWLDTRDAGIEIRLILRQSDIWLLSYHHLSVSEGIF